MRWQAVWSPLSSRDLDRIGSNSLGLGEPGARSRSGTPIKLYLSACIALISSTAYLACSSNEPATDGGSGGSGGEGAGDSGEETGQAGESATGGAGGSNSGGAGGSNSGGAGGSNSGGAGVGGTGGAGGGGSSTGGGAGTGSTEEAGIVTFDTFAFYRPALVSGADGVLHLAFNTNTQPSNIMVASCAADCGVAANWTTTVIDEHQFTGQVRMVVGSDNRLHVLYDASDGSEQLIYGTCASNCEDASSWSGVDLASLFGGGRSSPTHGLPLVIDEEGRLSFTVDRKIYLDGGVTLATCAGDCTDLGNWSAGTISSTGTRTSLAASGTTLHQLIDNADGSTTGSTLGYRTCAGDCTDPTNWEALDDLFVYDGAMPNAIAVTEEGGVRIVYNQGVSDSGQPADVKAQDNMMLIWGCDADCLERTSWSGIISGAAGDGVDGIAMVEFGGALVLSISNSNRVLTRVCTADCLLDTNWSEAEIDTSQAMTDEYDPFVYADTSCGSNQLEFASWHLTQGVTAVRPNGSVAFAHTAHILRTCFGSSTVDYVPGYGRVAYLP
ncbi:MAG TPA: hypothetical protein VI197_20985 [Polyangiaceae bacterium]